MRWAVLVCLIVGAGAGASAGQDKQSSAEAKAAFDRGRAAHNAGKRDEAVSAFERAVALEPTSSLYHLWLGHAYTRQLSTVNFLRKAFVARRSGEAYEMAVKLDPTSIDAAEGRLEFLLGAPGIVGGGVGKARAEAARIATLDAYRGGMAEARIAEHEKEWPKAERLYRSLLTDYPGADPARQSNAHYRLGIIKEKMGDPPAAAAEYQAALALNPRHGPAAAALKKIQ